MKFNVEMFDASQANGVALHSDKLIFENKIAHEWLTTEMAAQYLGISENALRIMVYRDQIRSHKLGRRLRFKLDDLKALFTMRGA